MKTNRDYFSWSQYNTWHTSKRAFWKQYNQMNKEISNKFFDKGKELAGYMETGQVPHSCNDAMLTNVAEVMPRLAIMEHKLEVPYKNTKLLGFVDSGEEEGRIFMEYKTGKVAWTQEKVDEHDQLLFYAYMYLIKNNKIPACKLVWIETMETPDGLMYTGEVHSFDRMFTHQEVIDFGKKIGDTIEEIDEYDYQELEISDSIVGRYAYLMEAKKEIEDELGLIKMQVHKDLNESGVTFGKGDRGNFIISSRKTWQYSDEVKVAAQGLKKMQAKEQKFGTASYTSKESIMFKFN
jgi:hypothetical protein